MLVFVFVGARDYESRTIEELGIRSSLSFSHVRPVFCLVKIQHFLEIFKGRIVKSFERLFQVC